MTITLTKSDIERLIKAPSVEARTQIVTKVCEGFNHNIFTMRERELAQDIFRLLLKDTEERVRKTLADELKSCSEAPHDVILALANDHSDIATLVLEHSSVLTDEDLLHIIEATQNLVKLTAIASRKAVSESVCQHLIDKNYTDVTKTLIQNTGSDLGEDILNALLDHHGHEHSLMEALVYRGGLPYGLAERLFSVVSDTLKKQLTRRYRLSLHSIDKSVENAKQTATLKFLSPWMSRQDMQSLIDQMHKNKRLTHNVVIRSLCIGDLRFFEIAMAKMVGVSIENAKTLMSAPGELGFDAFYDTTPLPEEFKDAVRILYNLAKQETGDTNFHREDFSKRIIARVIEEGHDKDVENMSYLLSIIGRSVQDVPTVH